MRDEDEGSQDSLTFLDFPGVFLEFSWTSVWGQVFLDFPWLFLDISLTSGSDECDSRSDELRFVVR